MSKTPKKSVAPPPKSAPVPAPPDKSRKRTVYVAFWMTPAEAGALQEAEALLEARTGKTGQRSEHLRGMVRKFVREVKLAEEFEV